MKIIKYAAFGRRINSDRLIAENVDKEYKNYFMDCLIKNNFNDDFSFALVPDDYKLFVKEEEKKSDYLKDYNNKELLEELIKRGGKRVIKWDGGKLYSDSVELLANELI